MEVLSRKYNTFRLCVSALFPSVTLPPSFFGWCGVTVTIVVRNSNHACQVICFVDICKKVRIVAWSALNSTRLQQKPYVLPWIFRYLVCYTGKGGQRTCVGLWLHLLLPQQNFTGAPIKNSKVFNEAQEFQPWSTQGRRQRGSQWCLAPHLKSVPPHFTFGPPVAAYIQYCI